MRKLSTIHDEIDDLFARFFGEEQPVAAWGEGPIPPVETFVRGEELVVRTDLPGVEPKDVDLSVEGNRLTIKGERKSVREEGDDHYREVRYGRFERSVALPEGIDPDTVKAAYKDGVLEVTMGLPKAMTPRKVQVTVH